MKFVCEKCSTRYSISDEKVAGKVLKIRCKTCGNIIVVRETGVEPVAQAAAGGGGRGPAPRTGLDMPSAQRNTPPSLNDPSIEWFVAIKGQQHGPMTHDAVVKLFHEGRISARSYCWNEALTGWARLRDLPEFAEVAATTAPPPPPPDEGAGAGAQVVDLQQHREQKAADGGNPLGAVDPFASVGGSPDQSGPPRESTRVFIMNAGLQNRSKKHRLYAAGALVSTTLLVGLLWADLEGHIELPLLHSVVTYAAQKTGVESEKRRKRRIIEAEFDAKLACSLDPTKCPKPVVKKRRRRRRPGNADLVGGMGDLDLGDAFATGGAEGSGGGVDSKAMNNDELGNLLGSNKEKSDQLKKLLGNSRPGMGVRKPIIGKGPKDRNVVKGGSSVPLTGKQLSPVFNAASSAVQDCVEKALKRGEHTSGKQHVVVTITPRGKVARAVFTDPVLNASALGHCITKRAKKMKFPPFAGEAFDVEWPLILGG